MTQRICSLVSSGLQARLSSLEAQTLAAVLEGDPGHRRGLDLSAATMCAKDGRQMVAPFRMLQVGCAAIAGGSLMFVSGETTIRAGRMLC